ALALPEGGGGGGGQEANHGAEPAGIGHLAGNGQEAGHGRVVLLLAPGGYGILVIVAKHGIEHRGVPSSGDMTNDYAQSRQAMGAICAWFQAGGGSRLAMVAVPPIEARTMQTMPPSCQRFSCSWRMTKPDKAAKAGWPLIRMPKMRAGILGRATISSA